ncbi:MAG: hypothetical protein IJ636_03850 [Bacteroidales bacterium]|nr:hypothetical protein [Bacteroidales bacterium]
MKKYGGVWHLCTPGEKQALIFNDRKDFVYAMTLVAMCAYDCSGIRIITFELMGNHVHFIICGSREQVLAFFALFKRRLSRYLFSNGLVIDLSAFDCGEPIPINNLESLRNQIAYTNRNNFVVDPDQTPFSYSFGANSYFFLPIAKERQQGRFGDLSILKKRKLVHSKQIDYPDTYTIVDGFFSPMNYCRLDIGESLFRDARHYFHKLSKNIEAYRGIATMLGDSIFYTDDELTDIIKRYCKENCNGQQATLLGRTDKMELARILHFEYNADNPKIARLLRLPVETLDELFPLRKKS